MPAAQAARGENLTPAWRENGTRSDPELGAPAPEPGRALLFRCLALEAIAMGVQGRGAGFSNRRSADAESPRGGSSQGGMFGGGPSRGGE